jgi:hypothetical protein
VHAAVAVPAPDRHVTERELARAQLGRRLPWAQLPQRMFAAKALKCPRCGRRMRVLAAIQTPEAIRAILECLGPLRSAPFCPRTRRRSFLVALTRTCGRGCARGQSLGGRVALPKMAMPTPGWLAYVEDPDGNVPGLMQPDPAAK